MSKKRITFHSKSFQANMQSSGFTTPARSDSGFPYRQASTINRHIFSSTPEPPEISFVSPDTPSSQSSIHYQYEYQPESSAPLDFTYQREAVFNSNYISYNRPDKSPTHSSQGSDYSYTSSLKILNVPAPPSHVDVAEYYKYVPNDLTPLQKTQQLLVWIAKREVNQDTAPETQGNPLAKRARIIANKIKQKVIEDLENGEINLSWYNRPDQIEQSDEKENPINISNAEKLDSFSQANRLIQDEIDDWKIYSENVYQSHAEAKDAILPNTTINHKDINVESMLLNLNEQQQLFFNKYCYEEEKEKHIKDYNIVYSGVTQIRHILNTVNQFAKSSQRYLDHRLLNLAKQTQERARIIPSEYDNYSTAGVFYDEREKKKSELESVQNIIRLSIALNVKRSPK